MAVTLRADLATLREDDARRGTPASPGCRAGTAATGRGARAIRKWATMTMLARRGRTDASDDALIEQVRAGDDEAFAELYRRHVRAANATARCLLRSRGDVDDAVSEAFAGVLQALRNGNGPRDNFRSYLLACVRNACYGRRWAGPGDERELDEDIVAYENPERYVEADTVARAFAALTPRWQRALWMTEVEDRSAADVGARLGLAPNAVAALTHRAREGFASAYLSEHVSSRASATCTRIGPRLGAYVRGTASAADATRVRSHLDECAECRRAADELTHVNASLRSLQGPAAVGASTATVIGLPVTGGLGALLVSGALVKVAAVALVVTPTLAIGVHRMDAAATEHRAVVGSVQLTADVAGASAEVAGTASGHDGTTADAASATAAPAEPDIAGALDPVPLAEEDAARPVTAAPAAATTVAGALDASVAFTPTTIAASVDVPTIPPVTITVPLPVLTVPDLPIVGDLPVPAVTTPAVTVDVDVPPIGVSVPPVGTLLPGLTVTVPAIGVSVDLPAIGLP